MVTRQIIQSTRFRKDYKRVSKRGLDLKKLEVILELLLDSSPLPERCKPHKLIGEYSGFWECHIEPDWLLIYGVSDEYLELAAMGSHSDLFR